MPLGTARWAIAVALVAFSACVPAAPPDRGAREPAPAQEEPQMPRELGRRIAETLCARCHALAPEATSPHPAAPPLPVLARRWPAETLLPRLEEGIVAVHPDMPEIRLAPAEIDPFLAFWSTL
ncbi:MAG: hypothetical protein N2038_02390 [Geminicoccaceae bacterium]|nr:hypothetical protein [Geminicoccaceae bacterium]MCS7268713.1 hypothetical protein [Geminicoccaceae bacterium]MCX7629079.1 hypothetical protein [Geminicoccaceae bacterium]MDW8125564.1 hypothetical protein [Geminicoccaceae bacterium]MDW8342213.1 hypothetical protein [Geminicoccaceae bacterium]